MRILFAFSLFLFIAYLPANKQVPGIKDAGLYQQYDEIKDNTDLPYQSSLYDSIGLIIVLDEGADFNEALVSCVHAEITNTEFRVNLLIPILKINPYFPNLITFGTDNTPPVS